MKYNKKSPYTKVDYQAIKSIFRKAIPVVLAGGVLMGSILVLSDSRLINTDKFNLQPTTSSLFAGDLKLNEGQSVELINETAGQREDLLNKGYTFSGATAEEDGINTFYQKGELPYDDSDTMVETVINNGVETANITNETDELRENMANEGYTFLGATAEEDGMHTAYQKGGTLPYDDSDTMVETVMNNGVETTNIINETDELRENMANGGHTFLGATAEEDGMHTFYQKGGTLPYDNSNTRVNTVVRDDVTSVEVINGTEADYQRLIEQGYSFDGICIENGESHAIYSKPLDNSMTR